MTAQPTAPTRWNRFVALGDSLTEGVGDPGADGQFRGWADRFAETVAGRQGELHYANLAIRGLTVRQILDTQLRPAVALKPDLVSAIAGMNDLIRPGLNFRQFASDLNTLVAGLAGTGAVVLTATLPTPGPGAPLPAMLRRRLVERLRIANAIIRRASATHGARCLDLSALIPDGQGPAGWSEDRLHPGPDAHQDIANAYLALLDDTPPIPFTVLGGVPGAAVAGPTVREQYQWLRSYLVPWVMRRLRGQSSADGVVAKSSDYRALAP